MNLDTARALAMAHLNTPEYAGEASGHALVIMDAHTQAHPFGWVFFYQSQRHLDTGDVMDMLFGNAPLIVDRRDGSVHITGTAHPIEHYVRIYSAAWAETRPDEDA